MSAITRTFLPWYRAGFATHLTGRPSAGSLRAALIASVALQGTPFSTQLPAQLTGPGDVVGLDPAEISRVEPYDGCDDFEPSYFPYVELLHPDLPWRFSPLGPEDANLTGLPTIASSRLRPWLCLAVVPAAKATLSGAAQGALPILTVDGSELPDPEDAWAWAHVQAVTQSGENVADVLTDASRSLARLVAPRRLEPSTQYVACLVPTFAAGRAALATGAPGGDPLADAWSSADTGVELPVYFSWRFTTGEAGSFETLARRLQAVAAPPAMAGSAIGTDAPGWGVQGTTGAQVLMAGALRPVGAPEAAGDATLAESLRTAVSSDGTGVDLRPPLYGQDYAQGATAIAPGAAGWLADLNTDPRRRIAAGLAAWSVAVEQDELADAAWQQLGAAGLNPPAQQISPELSDAVSGSLTRHDAVARQATPAALARLVRAGGPLSAAGLAAAAVMTTATTNATANGTSQPAEPAASSTGYAPSFPEPAYTLLRGVAPEWLLPGVGDVPDDSVLLVQSNPAFVEAFLVGLNHAMARELAWRRYPLNPTGTMFENFWAASSSTDSGIGAISRWPGESMLGSHSHSADQLVLLMRGALFRRFPTAQVYLSQSAADGSETHLTANLSGSLSTDIMFIGFPLAPAQALGAKPPWSVVIQESVHHARFGVDDPPPGGTAPLSSWQDLDWGNPQFQSGAYAPVAGPLLGTTHAIAAGEPTTATWGMSAGHQAVILQQPAFRIRIPVALWLTTLTSAPA